MMNKFFVGVAVIILIVGGAMVGEDPVLESPAEVAASVKQQLAEEARQEKVVAAIKAAKK